MLRLHRSNDELFLPAKLPFGAAILGTHVPFCPPGHRVYFGKMQFIGQLGERRFRLRPAGFAEIEKSLRSAKTVVRQIEFGVFPGFYSTKFIFLKKRLEISSGYLYNPPVPAARRVTR